MGRSRMSFPRKALITLALCLVLTLTSQVSGKSKHYLIETKDKGNDYHECPTMFVRDKTITYVPRTTINVAEETTITATLTTINVAEETTINATLTTMLVTTIMLMLVNESTRRTNPPTPLFQNNAMTKLL